MSRRNAVRRTTRLMATGLGLFCLGADPARAEGPIKTLTVTLPGIRDGASIPADNAFCIPARTGHVTLGPNRSPALKWSKGPYGTRTFAVLAYDTDAPEHTGEVNRDGKVITAAAPRGTFYHWVLVDIPLRTNALAAGAESDGLTPKGKPPGPAAIGRRGVNDYTGWFAGDPAMAGVYGGYDGPCPPWNEARLHHYHFAVYALDVSRLAVDGNFTGTEVMRAMQGHILAVGSTVRTYSLDPTPGK